MNEADGEAGNDAVNVIQMEAASQATLNGANAYADSILDTARTYTDSALSNANAYTDTRVSGILDNANAYTDTRTDGILNSANAYTDAKVNGLVVDSKRYADAGDAHMVQVASQYTNQVFSRAMTRAEFDTFSQNVDTRFRQVDRRLDKVGAMGTAMSSMALNTGHEPGGYGRWSSGQRILAGSWLPACLPERPRQHFPGRCVFGF